MPDHWFSFRPRANHQDPFLALDHLVDYILAKEMENQIFFDLNQSLRNNARMSRMMTFLRSFKKTTLQALALRLLLPTARESLLLKITLDHPPVLEVVGS
jgi:hypothetical protein